MIIETGMQQYCLRWNNHKTNLLTVFGELFRNEDFTDVTLACDNGTYVKCHRMVLAASSSYFQNLFSDLPYRHPVIVLKDVRYAEIQAILEYMYKGEVSVTVDEVAPLLKVAEALKVKGLMGDSGPNEECGAISTSSPGYGLPGNRTGSPNDLSRSAAMNAHQNEGGSSDSSVHNTSGHSSKMGESNENTSPPHSTVLHQQAMRSAYMYAKAATRIPTRLPWPAPQIVLPSPHPHSASVLCNNYYDAGEMPTPPSMRKKKNSGFNMNRDTPILRTVLGQGQPDSSQPMSQPMSLVLDNSDGPEQPQSNGPTTPQDGSYGRMKSESSHEDAHSPYMESSFMDEECQERGGKVMHSSSSSPQSFYSDTNKGGVSAGIASYVPNQKPEWKRYKQYTRTEIMSAIEAVRKGMSALQAARKYGVPSRTLYDKVKKLGITTSRPFRRSNGSNGAGFPFGLSGTGGAMYGSANDDDASQGAVIQPGFLQQALQSSGSKVKLENVERDALSTNSPPQMSPNALLLQRALDVDERMKSEMVVDREALCSTPGDHSGQSSASPSPNERPAPTNLIKYPSQSQERPDEYDDVVEDLSMTRKPEPQPQPQPQPQPSRVIMPPMNQAQASMLANCTDMDRD